MDNVQKQKENIAYSTKKKGKDGFSIHPFLPTFTLIIAGCTCGTAPPARIRPIKETR